MNLINYPKTILFSLLLLTFIIYFPGLSGDFILDDQSSIVDENSIRISTFDLDTLLTTANSGITGPLKRPVATISFALNYYLFGLDPFYFKLINVFIHLLTGICLYILSSLIATRFISLTNRDNVNAQSIAVLCTALWLLHPLNLSSVLYIVQRMNELSALFTFLSLIFYCLFRERQILSRTSWLFYLFMYLFTITLGLFSKENALLIPMFSFLIEIFIFKFKSRGPQSKQNLLLYGLYFITLALPLILYFALYFNLESLENAHMKYGFTLKERVYSEFNILIFYLTQIFIPDISVLSIFHDGWPVSNELVGSDKTTLSFLLIAILMTSAIALYRRKPIYSFAILWFFIGHSLESTIFPLELIFEHRNYVPIFGPVFLIAYYLHHYLLTGKRRTGIIIISIYLTFLSTSTLIRATEWGSTIDHIISEQQRNPQSYRANLQLGNLYRKTALLNQSPGLQQKLQEKAVEYYQNASRLKQNFTVAYLGTILLYAESRQAIPDTLLNDYSHSLEFNPVHISTVFNLKELNNCYYKPDCSISSNEMETLYLALLKNKHLSKKHRAMASAYYADYFQFNKNHIKALMYMQLAHNNDPKESTYKFRLIQLLIKTQHFAEAKEMFEKLEKREKTTEFLHLEKQLQMVEELN